MKYVLAIIMLLIIGCGEDASGFNIDEPDGSVDTDADTNSDTDTDTDTDADSDSCEDIICDDVPTDECIEGGFLISYTGEAMCIDDECHYSYEIIECNWGCMVTDEGEACTPYPCDGYSCDSPPAGYCEETTENYDTCFNYQPGGCYVDENDQPQCAYGEAINEGQCTHDGSAGTTPEYCEVIDGFAQCVEK